MNNSHTALFAIITVAFLILAGVLVIFSNDPAMHNLATVIIAGILGLWVPSPIQSKTS